MKRYVKTNTQEHKFKWNNRYRATMLHKTPDLIALNLFDRETMNKQFGRCKQGVSEITSQ